MAPSGPNGRGIAEFRQLNVRLFCSRPADRDVGHTRRGRPQKQHRCDARCW